MNSFQASYAFKFNMRKWVPSIPDYSTLPTELLYMIANNVAEVGQQEEKGQKISTHLFKMRLLCKKFSTIATATFQLLVQGEDFSDYTILHLPPKSGSLDRLLGAFSPKSIMSTIVTSVIYHVVSSPQRNPDYDEWQYYVIESKHNPPDCGCDKDDMEMTSPDMAMNKNERRFVKLCRAQDVFAEELSKPDALKKLRTIFSRLQCSSSIQFEMKDFWNGTSWDTPGPEVDAPAAKFYHSALPVLLDAVGAGTATDLKVKGLGSFAFGPLHPLLITKLGRKKDFMKNIVNVDFVLTHSDDVGGLEYGEPCLTALRRADRLSLLLSCIKNVESLSLSYEDECHWNEMVELDEDEAWLGDVLQGQKWTCLRNFTLRKFKANGKMLKALCRDHRGTLKHVTLDSVEITAAEWVSLLNFMRNELNLTTASITLSRSVFGSVPALQEIMTKYDTGATSVMVDIGAYVLPPAREVIELE